jgi:hypothetical protein
LILVRAVSKRSPGWSTPWLITVKKKTMAKKKREVHVAMEL